MSSKSVFIIAVFFVVSNIPTCMLNILFFYWLQALISQSEQSSDQKLRVTRSILDTIPLPQSVYESLGVVLINAIQSNVTVFANTVNGAFSLEVLVIQDTNVTVNFENFRSVVKRVSDVFVDRILADNYFAGLYAQILVENAIKQYYEQVVQFLDNNINNSS